VAAQPRDPSHDHPHGRTHRCGRARGTGEAWLFEVDDDLAEAFLAEADTIQHLAGNAAAGVFLGVEEELPLPPTWSADHDNAHFSALCTWDGVDGVRLEPRDYLGWRRSTRTG
jgi:hypothetical protein